MIDLKNQIAVVTGGGRGLGRAFAQALGAKGASVAVIARSSAELKETVSLIPEQARAFPADVTDAEAVRAAFAEIENAMGPIDLLVNNAGVLGPIGPFSETPFEDWWRAFDVNLRGAMMCTQAAMKSMMPRGRGRIINIVTGAVPAAYLSAYMSSKTALVRAGECLAAELKPFGIAVFSVAPGTVRTDMSMHSVNSTEGRKWIPWFRRIFDEGIDVPAERPAELVVALASGKADVLSGLYLTPFDDLDALISGAAEIEAQKLYSLRVRTQGTSPAAAAIAAIRDSAMRVKT